MLIYVIFQEVGLTLLSCVPKNMQIPEKGPAKKGFSPFSPWQNAQIWEMRTEDARVLATVTFILLSFLLPGQFMRCPDK